MFRHRAIVMTILAVTALAGCSSRKSDEFSRGDDPYAGPANERGVQYAGGESAAGPGRRTSAYARSSYRPGDTGYYSRWAYEYGRDPSYDYYLASDAYGGWDDEFPEEYAYFHDELDPYGDWYLDARYGWVWSPGYVRADWRPYLDGYWVYTDWGWTWVSYDPWGADTYHYGRWDCLASNRWVWIPDDVWGPAWVSWRYGDGWAGWAPLPPEATWGSFGLSYSDHFVLPSRWCFVPESRLTSTRLRSYVAPLPETRGLYRDTRDVTRYAVVDGRPAERGLKPALIERRTGRNIPEYRLVTRERGQRRDIVRGRTLVSPMPVSARGAGRGAKGRFDRERNVVRPDRADRGDRRPMMQRDRTQLERGRQMRMERDRQVERGRQMRMERDQQVERGRQMRMERDQQVERGRQMRMERDRQMERGRQMQMQRGRQMQRDRAENENRDRAQQDRFERDQARQRGQQALERDQVRQQAEQVRAERRQQQEQPPPQQQEQPQQQRQQARGRRDGGPPQNDPSTRGDGGGQQAPDQRGHGRGHGRDR